MSNRSAMGVQARPPIYQPHVQPVMQDLLRILADLDYEHDAAVEQLEASATETNLKAVLAERLKVRHRERRQPYVQMLADLHNRSLGFAAPHRIV
jgi:hypothetical protein